ncbi:MAG: coproporphyrinogen dehydrogenase, partial [Alphaproteobacteria bacterium]
PDMIHTLARAVKAVFPPHDDFEFSVEIDPTTVDGDKIHALAEEGLNRASIGIQDFDPVVQEAIGRIQSFDTTDACVGALRDEGVGSLNTDLVYGLPHQDSVSLAGTLEQVLRLAPDRIALFGYAHVPWMSKRQRLIDESVLPDDLARYALAEQAASRFAAAGYEPIGIDHFARPGDGLQEAAASGRVRRNFQGYTDDVCPTLIGVGASSISRFAQGYVQNAHKTADYMRSVGEGRLGGARGHALSEEDRLRARAIEMLMCDFRLDRTALARQFGEMAARLDLVHALVSERFGDLVALSDEALEIRPEGRALTRIIAGSYDAYAPEGVRYSRAT